MLKQQIGNIKDLFQGKMKYTVETNNLIKQLGGKYIKRMIIMRTPLSKPMTNSLNVASGFNFFDKLKRTPYDQLFHLEIVLVLDNSFKLSFEKIESVNLKIYRGNPSNAESMEIIPIPSNMNVQTLIDNTRKNMGDNKYLTYNVSSNNCQNFIVNVIQASIQNGDIYINFVKQNTEFVFRNNPSLRKFINTLTTTKRVGNVLMGRGIENKTGNNNWINFVKKYAKDND